MLLSSVIGLGMISCRDEMLLEDKDQGTELKPDILRAQIYFRDYEETPGTRFSTDTTDRWSIGGSQISFTSSDTVGIFSRWGNMNLPTKDGRGGPLINVPMYFVQQGYNVPLDPNDPKKGQVTAYTLQNDTVEVFPPAMKTGNGLFMYYPYTPDIGNLRNYPLWQDYVDVANISNGSIYYGTGYTNSGFTGKEFPVIPGLELRVKAPDGSVRCRDVVEMFQASTADLSKGVISGAVYHGFSEIIVTRGDGFDKPVRIDENGDKVPDYSVYVVLDRPLTHLRVITYQDWVRWTTQLFYDPDYEFDGKKMTEEEARRWYAWEGAMYPYTKDLPLDQRKRAWYVIIPTIYHTNGSYNGNTNKVYGQSYSQRPVVSEICLYDNDGYLQHVTSFTLKTSDGASPTKAPYPYYRWPIEIAMDELGPVVRPVTIENWDEEGPDKNITDERTTGIYSIQELKDWSIAYNSYISSGRTSGDDKLWKYGDNIDGVWHFYVGDFDFTSQPFPTISVLEDVIEGNNQFFNVVWSNLSVTAPLFGTISRHGGMKNLDIVNPTLKTSSTDPKGLLAGQMQLNSTLGAEEKTFENVHIKSGTVLGAGPVGLLAGTVDFCRIENCSFAGKVIGTSTSDDPANLFGENPTRKLNIGDDTTYSNIIFGRQ